MIIVTIMTLKMGRMAGWKRKKLWLEQKTGQVYARLKNTNTTEKQLVAVRKKIWKRFKILYITPTTGHYPRNG